MLLTFNGQWHKNLININLYNAYACINILQNQTHCTLVVNTHRLNYIAEFIFKYYTRLQNIAVRANSITNGFMYIIQKYTHASRLY